MDYKGTYGDLAQMQQRALRETLKADRAGDIFLSEALESFIAQLNDFMDAIALRRW